MSVDLIELVEKTIVEKGLTNKAKIAVYCSGGVDSTTLLDILIKLKSKYDFKLSCFHYEYTDVLNHDLIKEFLRFKCEKHSVHFYTTDAKSNNNILLSGREAKIQFAFSKNFDAIYLGHHRDDNIENALIRMFRASGSIENTLMQKYTTMSIKDKQRLFIRPFIDISKVNIYEYANRNNVTYYEDSTNKDAYASDRNFLRLKIIPELKSRFNVENVVDFIVNSIVAMNSQRAIRDLVDFSSGSWSVEELFKYTTEEKIELFKEHLKSKYGFGISKRIYDTLKTKLSCAQDFRVLLSKNLVIEKMSGKYSIYELDSAQKQ